MSPCAGARGFLWVCRMAAQTVRISMPLCVAAGISQLEGHGIAGVVLVNMSRA